eukprot:Em0022g757a
MSETILTNDPQPSVPVTSDEIVRAIQSFPCGSAGGTDGLRPQHLKDMVSLSAHSEKKGGGIRPIAVGCTLRRLAAKVASGKVMVEMATLLSPRQLGYGVSQGAEAAVYAARFYLRKIGSSKVLLKLDFRNAFNSIRRDKMLEAVQRLAPSIYPFVHSVYSSPSSLFWSDKITSHQRGSNKEILLGHSFSASQFIMCMCSQLKSELCIFYLDDGTLGGVLSDVLYDIEVIKKEAGIVGLELNPQKSEVIVVNSDLI